MENNEPQSLSFSSLLREAAVDGAAASWDAHDCFKPAHVVYDFMREMVYCEDARHDLLPEKMPLAFKLMYWSAALAFNKERIATGGAQ